MTNLTVIDGKLLGPKRSPQEILIGFLREQCDLIEHQIATLEALQASRRKKPPALKLVPRKPPA
jgi:hypothetical protein